MKSARFFILSLCLWMSFFSSPAKAYVDEENSWIGIISPYEPLYFLFGKLHSKFQVSVKANLIKDTPLYFTYTQTSFWDLGRPSAPFSDTSYSPAIFYRVPIESHSTWLDAGIKHESNGRDGPESRGWNRIFAQYSANNSVAPKSLQWSVMAWIPFPAHDGSIDLPQYRGIYDITVTWSDFLGKNFDKDDLIFRFYPGGSLYINPFLGGQELTFRIRFADQKFTNLFIAQMFHGYGETLLDYKDDTWVLRVGIGF